MEGEIGEQLQLKILSFVNNLKRDFVGNITITDALEDRVIHWRSTNRKNTCTETFSLCIFNLRDE